MIGDTAIAVSKLARLIVTAARDPREGLDRLTTIVEERLDRLYSRPMSYPSAHFCDVLSRLRPTSGVTAEEVVSEIIDIEDQVSPKLAATSQNGPFKTTHNGDPVLGRLCYAFTRFFRPDVVLETGVAYGVTSTYVLRALQRNQRGHLHSVDLPPLGERSDDCVGLLVPYDLRNRWTLHRGMTRRVLPELVAEMQRVDIFVHDSLHTRANMQRELSTVLPYLSSHSAVIVDDIERNCAFAAFVEKARPQFHSTLAHIRKSGACGVAAFDSQGPWSAT